MATYRTFARGKEKYSLSDKKHLGELISSHKEKYDKELKELEGLVFLFSTIFPSKSS